MTGLTSVPDDLEWSHRIVGARRAALEEFSRWSRGRGQVAFSIVPDDFPTNGPHRLVLQTRVRTAGLSDAWEIELPHVPFQFDFDPVLRLDAILTLSDSGRDEAMSRAIRLESENAAIDEPARLLPLGAQWVMRNPPRLAVETPLPSDLAHRVSVEFEGAPARFPAGALILSGQGLARTSGPATTSSIQPFRPRPDRTVPGGRYRSARVRADAGPPRGGRPARLGRSGDPLGLARRDRDELGRGRDHPDLTDCRPATIRAATRTAAIRLDGSARPFQAMSKAVPCATLVRTIGSPSVTFTARWKPTVLSAMCPWSWYIATTASYSPPRADEERVIRMRTGRVEPLATGLFDRGPDQRLLLVAEQPILAGMRIERCHGDPGTSPAGQGPHRLVGQADLREDRVTTQQVEDPAQCHVQRHVDDPQAGRRIVLEIEHHRVIGGVAPLREDLGVPGMTNAGLVEGLLVQGQGGDRVDSSGERQVDRGVQEGECGAAGPAVDRARAHIVEITETAARRQAGNRARHRVCFFRGGDDLDVERMFPAGQGHGALEDLGSPITTGRARARSAGSSQPRTITSGPIPATSPIVRPIKGRSVAALIIRPPS